jgi:hypothetical protein
LGYPIVEVEMQDINFYAAFEDAVNEYSSHVNQINIRDNLLHMQGQPTSSNLSQQVVTPTLARTVFMSQQYGSETGAGGFVDWKMGHITANSSSNEYDLNALFADVSESGAAIEVKRVFHDGSPAISRYFDPYAGTGAGSYNMMDNFGWGNMTPAVQFMMMPIYADLLRIQAIEFNDQIRKSAYHFEIRNNKLKLFPIPTTSFAVWFEYIIVSERDNSLVAHYSGSTSGKIADYSNIPYNNMTYTAINSVGKQWIRKYALANARETLGDIRSKFGSIPIPDSEVQLDGETMRAEAIAEKERLVTELRETLEAISRKALVEADKEESENLQEKLNKIPVQIYIGLLGG